MIVNIWKGCLVMSQQSRATARVARTFLADGSF
jgi:hypothetical protein